MIQLRYNGCPSCLKSCKTVLSSCGYFEPKDYTVEFHQEHKKDPIYGVRPDYLDVFSGGILYNPDTGHWVDFYDKEHVVFVLTATTKQEKDKVRTLFEALKDGA